MLKIISTALLALSLTACVSPYQKHGWTGGYKDENLGGGRYKVGYYGNGSHDFATVTEFWKRRATELCAPQGYKIMEERAGAGYASPGIIPIVFVHPKREGEIQCTDTPAN